MGGSAPAIRPQRAPTWLLGSGHGVQVWTVHNVDARLLASVLIGDDPPVILLNSRIANTPGEGAAIAWAFEHIAAGERGFFVRRGA